jgi:hypothetical protein
MFHKVNHHVIRQTLNNLKRGIHTGYHHVKTIGHHINHGVNVAKHAYSILEPVIKELAPQAHHNIHNNVMKGISHYENLRNNVQEANNHVSSVSHKLKGLL